MNKRKALSMIGMSKKAGRLRQGFDAVKDSVYSGEAYLVLLAGDLSERTAGQMEKNAREAGVPVIRSSLSMDEIGQITGRVSGVIAVADEGLAQAVKNAICLEEEMN